MDSKRTIALLKLDEGRKAHVYDDRTGKWVKLAGKSRATIGYGRNVDIQGGPGLSLEEMEFMLQNDVANAFRWLAGFYPWFLKLDDVRQAVIISMWINLGITRLRKFERGTLALIADGKYEEAAVMLSKNRGYMADIKDRGVRFVEMLRSGKWPENLRF